MTKVIFKRVAPGIEKEGVPGKDFIPLEWVNACEEYGRWKIVRTEYPTSEELDKALKNEIEEEWLFADKIEVDCLECIPLIKDELEVIARKFYDLGCSRTAEKYDEIEYNRQRAEEAELSEDLEGEMDKYFESMEVQEHENIFEDTFHKIASHFAEWGMNQMPLPEDTTIFQKGVAEGKRLMMEGAVDGRYMKAIGKVFVESWPLDINPDSVKAGDEVRLIVLPKED